MISFVIRTKNEEDKIRNVLESIRSQVTSEDIEIIKELVYEFDDKRYMFY